MPLLAGFPARPWFLPPGGSNSSTCSSSRRSTRSSPWAESVGPNGRRVTEGTPSWADLSTTDLAGSKEFYSSLLGWEFTVGKVAAADFFGKVFGWKASQEDLGPGMQMTVFSVGDDVVASAMDVPMPGVPPHWQVYFGVDDCDAACAKVTELGGSILIPPMDAAPGRMAAVTDPAGAAFSIIAMAGQTG